MKSTARVAVTLSTLLAAVMLMSGCGLLDSPTTSTVSAADDPHVPHSEEDTTTWQNAQEPELTLTAELKLTRGGRNQPCTLEVGGTVRYSHGAQEGPERAYVMYHAPAGGKPGTGGNCPGYAVGMIPRTAYDGLLRANTSPA